MVTAFCSHMFLGMYRQLRTCKFCLQNPKLIEWDPVIQGSTISADAAPVKKKTGTPPTKFPWGGLKLICVLLAIFAASNWHFKMPYIVTIQWAAAGVTGASVALI